jgi:8-amino-7-oxononanoate synthase
MLDYLKNELQELNREGLIRKLRVISALKGAYIKIDNKWLISFCSNDYLGLAQHPKVKKAMLETTRRFGAGAGSARLLSGTTLLHHKVEQELAKFKKTEDAIFFTSGYVANLSVITSLVKKDDILLCDELNHASLIDATRLTGANIRVYRHCDMDHLERLLSNRDSRSTLNALRYIITDTIFSMDGDSAPLKEITRLSRKYGACTIVDEAHATGVFGKNARGIAEESNTEDRIDIIIGTASKALGIVGGFVTGKNVLTDYIRNKARQFIFTTALPAGVCAGVIASLSILQGKEGSDLRAKLWENTDYLKSQLLKMEFDLRKSVSPIVPILLGDTRKTIWFSHELYRKGLYVPAIRPPTVPQDASRLRITLTAMHSKKDINLLLQTLQRIVNRDPPR